MAAELCNHWTKWTLEMLPHPKGWFISYYSSHFAGEDRATAVSGPALSHAIPTLSWCHSWCQTTPTFWNHSYFFLWLPSTSTQPPVSSLPCALVWHSLSVLTMDILMDQATRWIGAPLYNDMTISLTDILYCLQTIAGDQTTVSSSITWHDNYLWWANGTWTTITTAGYPSPWRGGYGLYH